MFWMQGSETLVILSAVPTIHCRVRFTTVPTPDRWFSCSRHSQQCPGKRWGQWVTCFKASVCFKLSACQIILYNLVPFKYTEPFSLLRNWILCWAPFGQVVGFRDMEWSSVMCTQRNLVLLICAMVELFMCGGEWSGHALLCSSVLNRQPWEARRCCLSVVSLTRNPESSCRGRCWITAGRSYWSVTRGWL